MNEHLQKAKNALADAAAMDVDIGAVTLPRSYIRLVDLAAVQASIAQAEILEGILEALKPPRLGLGGPR